MTTKGEYVRVTIMTLSLALGLTLVLGALVARVNAQEVSSIRDSSSEWQCETRDGTVLSSHTRQDKAFRPVLIGRWQAETRLLYAVARLG